MRAETEIVRPFPTKEKEARESSLRWLMEPMKQVKIVRPLATREEDTETYIRRLRESRKRVKETGEFDIKRSSECGLRREVINAYRPCPVLVSVYARLGLHRYNFFKGTKFQFIRVKKYVETTSPLCAATYYITMEAMDPASSSPRLRIFQIRLSENILNGLTVTCDIARIRRKNITDTSEEFECSSNLPEWPSENPFVNNSKRYYLVKDSEVEVNDWIRLYLEAAVAADHRSFYSTTSEYDESKLKILKVAIEETSKCDADADAGDNVIVIYIRYKDLCEARVVGKDVDRVAVIRRSFNKVKGLFSLEGQTLSSESVVMIPEEKVKKKNQSWLSLEAQNLSFESVVMIPEKCKKKKKNLESPLSLEGQNLSSESVVMIPVKAKKKKNLESQLSLEAQNLSSESVVMIPKKCKKKKNQSQLRLRRLGVFKPLRLSNPRVCESYIIRGVCVGVALRLHKDEMIQ